MKWWSTVQCRERITVQSDKVKVRDELRYALRSRSWTALCAVALLITCALTLRTSGIVYYAKYVLENEQLATLLLAMSPISMLVSSPFIGQVLDRVGNGPNAMLNNGSFFEKGKCLSADETGTS